MDWDRQQERALREVATWHRSRDRQVFRLFGYAGTGKTTLARHFADGVDGDVVFAAYTGKAAQVLRERGCPGASTIHSLIYRTKEKPRERLRELESRLLQAEAANAVSEVSRLRDELRGERLRLSQPSWAVNGSEAIRAASLVVIDECSMVDGRMAEDLLSFGKPVLVLGDPAQLPPVMGGGAFTEGVEPDIMLTDIHRQARDNPIIDLATRVREGGKLEIGTYGDSRVIKPAQLTPEDALAADQILVGRNATRVATNRRVRHLRGYPQTPWPVDGERLICLRNNHDRGLLNGSLWVSVGEPLAGDDEGQVLLTVRPDGGGEELDALCWSWPFYQEKSDMPWWERQDAEEFTHGHAITVHKSQGSQFGTTLVMDEWKMQDSRQRWLYTAITRAQRATTIVQM